jgi:hypothetical protein
MMFRPTCSYERIDQRELSTEIAVAWSSSDSEDACWDRFLQETTLGQYQQSTIWARAKHSEGWKPVRVLVTVNDEIVAGFQMLWQSSWRGRMGYVSKGPVVLPGHHGLAEYITELLQITSRKMRVRALVVQPPDSCGQMSEKLVRGGFLPNTLTRVNDATWIVDLRAGFDAVAQGICRSTRQKAKQAVSRGLAIREGERQDIQEFFDLMLSSCQRQGVKPSPSNIQHLLALWDAAHPAGCIRLSFAEHEGKRLAGLLCITFGKTFTAWKKGWTSADGNLHPNELCNYEALRWATQSGYQFCDFSAFDRQMAIALLSGEPLSHEQESSRHTFHVRFGGSPRLLPEAMAYFPNPLIRLAYRLFFYKNIRRAEKECRLTQAHISKA